MKVSITLTDEQVKMLESVSVDDFPKYLNQVIGTHFALVKSALHRLDERNDELEFEYGEEERKKTSLDDMFYD